MRLDDTPGINQLTRTYPNSIESFIEGEGPARSE